MIVIVNYGSGNINAIANIYDSLKVEYRIATDVDSLLGASKIILPGVGAFDETMKMLKKSGFIDTLNNLVLDKKVPVLGICVGMQIFADESEEGVESGLGWIAGKVKRFDSSLILHKPKTPHLGWNSISIKKDSTGLFKDIEEDNGFYFLHSFYYEPKNTLDILTESFYGVNFCSAVNLENIFGVQFHPEKSHSNGVILLKNFANLPLC